MDSLNKDIKRRVTFIFFIRVSPLTSGDIMRRIVERLYFAFVSLYPSASSHTRCTQYVPQLSLRTFESCCVKGRESIPVCSVRICARFQRLPDNVAIAI